MAIFFQIHTASFDWELAHKAGKDVHAYVPEAAERAKGLVQRLYNAADDIRMQTDEGIRTIVECYLEINDICIPLGHYRAEEGPEHFFAYNVEYLTGRTFVHGWLVGLGIQLMSRLQENDSDGIVSIMDRLGLPHSPRANQLTRSDIRHALETLRDRTLADKRWYGIIHQRDITANFIEHVMNLLDYA